jgi:CIC family chloride channel protein
VVASITGSVLARIFWGQFPVFKVMPFFLLSNWELAIYLGLGLACGLAAICFVRLIFGLDSAFSRLPLPEWLKPALGGLGLGLLALQLPEVLGVGYETVNAALTDSLGLRLALTLLGAKLLATSLCIGSGMSGGIFAPSLFLGAMLGTAVGLVATAVLPDLAVSPAFFALAGMGGMVSGTTLAPITAIVTIFELTLQYQIILPLMLTCISSTLVVRFLFGYSVYEMKLLRRGINIVRGHDVGILRNLLVRDFMRRDFTVVREDTPLQELYGHLAESAYPHFVVLNASDELRGVVSLRDLRKVLPRYEELKESVTAGELMTRKVVTLKERDHLETALHVFERNHFSFVPVLRESGQLQVLGIMTKDDLLTAYDQKVLKDRVLSCPMP